MLTCDNGNAILATAPPGPPTSITEPFQKNHNLIWLPIIPKNPFQKNTPQCLCCVLVINYSNTMCFGLPIIHTVDERGG
jgi:hypothetical protein